MRAPLTLATHFDALAVAELDLGSKLYLCNGFINERYKDKDGNMKNRCIVRYLRIDSGDMLSNASGSQQSRHNWRQACRLQMLSCLYRHITLHD